MTTRCAWAENSDIERDYHDTEWGRPLRDEQRLFEFLCLEGAQAGLSWRTVLAKRDNYRRVFHDFAIARCAAMTDAELETVLADPGIVRNRLKVYSVRKNARAALEVIRTEGSLSTFLWRFVGGEPIDNRPRERGDVPATTPASDQMSKALQKRGFTFVGSTICYALMQATGMVNDHQIDCIARQAPGRARRKTA
ncbi:DNA-3-methyladenine glycosylase I [Tahibacter amnicola]|uniref:DNA-3-methyladenine glycosylase I n=1 Tax=Tahibacter amnicola TaxID=2976241 RepID=A0ABY6BDS2_9GAMM|nr:DNA-3-methyladenine glycosylase I [Tahibacter amnicola]UXI68183.1 DNA-3-methyladenine glycosylase I [Tahibacter amnicola]